MNGLIASIRARELSFRYRGQDQWLFEQISFELKSGQISALTGPSGSGKSTLCYCLSGVIPRFIKGEFSGDVSLEGRVGMVFQDPDSQLFLPTVEDELAFGPENLCLPREEIGRRIESILQLIGLHRLRLANPVKLSGGGKQLVALGGVLTLDPDIILLDEPFSQLDDAMRGRIKTVLLELKRQGKAIVFVEHDKSNLEVADQIWLLSRGGLNRQSSPEVISHD
ncbi:MAG TPA: ABC transporter ATP-binding protein [Syntrophomonas sp.]|nr:ABC transporter ATP-binding protein [Syntrophomonas sp.]